MSGNRALFYTRPGCHLCDDVRPVVERAAALARVEIEEVDVDGTAETAADYGLRIPVVVGPSGRVLAEGEIGLGRLLAEMLRERLGR